MLVLAASLASCGYEKGFEYMSETELIPIGDSGVAGSVVIGYGIENHAFRMRIALHGLNKDRKYHVRFLDATSCNASELANARRIDAKRDDPDRKKEAWGFEDQPALLISNFFGITKQEFKLSPPSAPSIYSMDTDKYPTVVITPADNSEASLAPVKYVACGTISAIPTNRRPHM